jgi:hypothetical protein
MTTTIRDNRGQIIGRIDVRSDKTVYLTNEGRVVGFVKDDRTFESSGKFVGYGDLGLLILSEYIR